MAASNPIRQALADILPQQVALCLSTTLPAGAKLLPAEAQHTSGMVARRKTEFTHGRYCARSALEQLGINNQAIAKGSNREPLWPKGTVGSISHTANAALAVAARQTDLRSIGIDMEQAGALKDDLIDMICRPEENPQRDGHHAKLLFTAKEAVYKCLYPLLGGYIDFLEMEVVVDQHSESFTANSHTDLCAPSLALAIEGRVLQLDDMVISVAWIS